MIEAAIPQNETQRLQALYSYRILDSEPDAAFDDLVDLTAALCEAPISLVSLVDSSRQWFKARVGLNAQETSRSVSFCAHAILHDNLFIVTDTHKDDRFASNPLVTGPPYIRFYAGAPLLSQEGFALGTLCVIDTKPRSLTELQMKVLLVLRRHVHFLMEMRGQNNELKILNRELDSFSAAVSHDLVAPVRRILGFCGILLEDYPNKLEQEGVALVRRIEKSATSMKEMVSSLLKLSRLSRTEINIDKVNLSEIAQDMLSDIQSTSPDRVGETIVEPDIVVYGDSTMLRILMANLIDNAWKYSVGREITQIKIGTENKNGRQIIYVSDNGIGFDMTNADKVFNPFQRLHTEQHYPGSGIGLSTVERIINKHGGNIWVESKAGIGTTFFFTLG